MEFRQVPITPASPRKRFPRALAVVLLGLQAFLWGGGAIAEARTAAESLSRYSHVEDPGRETCPPLHRHLDCLICRTFSSGATGGGAPSFIAVLSDVTERASLVSIVPGNQRRLGTLGSRAPPSA